MISPNPISLLCALLLCLPLAIIFTVNTPLVTTKSASSPGGATTFLPKHLTPQNKTITKEPFTPTLQITIINKTHKPNTPSIFPSLQLQQITATTEDDIEDESLFQLAARVNSNSRAGRPRKIAFMFITTTPLPLAPLWELYFNKTPSYLYNIYIHADPSSRYDSPFRGVFAHRVIPSKPTSRFSPTLISAARRLLSHALLHDTGNYMFALLSPSCIPLHSFDFTYKTLMKSRRSFIEILKNEKGAVDRWAARGERVMLPEVTLENFRIGSQFFVLTRKHARVVTSDTRLWGKFKLQCVRLDTCYPEEHYFATLLSMRDPRGCVPATLTHVDWRGCHDGHPRTYLAPEVGPELILALRNATPRYGDDGTNGSDGSVRKRRHPFLFARKFSPKTIEPLLEIANDVIFRD